MTRLLLISLLLFLFSCTNSNKKAEENIPVEEEVSKPELWVWIHAHQYTQPQMDSIFEILYENNFTGVLIKSDSTLLRRAVLSGQKHKIKVQCWMWTMNSGGAKPEWLSYNKQGHSLKDSMAYVGYYKFMCPAMPEVREYIKSNMRALMSVEGMHGLHMDYVRYVDVILPKGLQPKYNLVQDREMPKYDYGYHPYMRKIFKEEYGVDPVEIEDEEMDKTWRRFRLDKLNEAISEFRELADSFGVELTAAVFPTPEMSAYMVRQDWGVWPLHRAFPMQYHNFYEAEYDWITECTKDSRATMNENTMLIPGLYIPALQDSGSLTQAIQAAFDGGAEGVALFEFHGLKDYHFEEISAYFE